MSRITKQLETYYNMLDRNAEIFEETRQFSTGQFRVFTNQLKKSTFVYADPTTYFDDSQCVHKEVMEVSFVNAGTINTAYRLKDVTKRVALLNFADAKRPGGWVIEGAPTQEENICRCTNLYEALILPACKECYYDVNTLYSGNPNVHIDEPYTDALIYSENVLIFRDDQTYELKPYKKVDVITSPAPCGAIDNVEEILIYRMRGIVKAAYSHGVNYLVLGAWGCGAFGQDPEVVAMCFRKVLEEYPVFDKVVFAIKATEGLVSNNDALSIFMDVFEVE